MYDSIDDALKATPKRVAFAICEEVRREMPPEDLLELAGSVTQGLPPGEWRVTIEEDLG